MRDCRRTGYFTALDAEMNVTQIDIVHQLPLGHFYSGTLTRRHFIRVAFFITLASQKSDFSISHDHLPLETVTLWAGTLQPG